MIGVVLPEVAQRLGVRPPYDSFCRLTRSVPHAGDIVISHLGCVGFLELKDHKRGIPAVDRRRFFDNVMIQFGVIDWAILASRTTGIPSFCERGSTAIGFIRVDSEESAVLASLDLARPTLLPVAFVGDIEGQQTLDVILSLIRTLSTLSTRLKAVRRPTLNSLTTFDTEPHRVWNVDTLIERGELPTVRARDWGLPQTALSAHSRL